MRLLLDTHALIWLAEATEDIDRSGRKIIDEADSVLVSAISFWETAMLEQRGRIALSLPVAAWRDRVLEAGFEELPVSGVVAIESVHLPGQLHGDPADRLLVATARIHQLRLVTRDTRLLDYGATGNLDVMSI